MPSPAEAKPGENRLVAMPWEAAWGPACDA